MVDHVPLHRSGPPEDAAGQMRSFAFGPFVLIPARQLLLKSDVPVHIGGRALDILISLVERAGELVTKRELIAEVWPNLVVEESNLKVNMTALRKILGESPGPPQYIATVFGRGYRFIAPVQRSSYLAQVGGPLTQNGLPVLNARIVGRSGTIHALLQELEVSRLLTVVGPGGLGKTTVAIASAREFSTGSVFVDLATISDAQFVPSAIAAALGVVVTNGDPLASVIHVIGADEKLIVIDNCEHVLAAVVTAADRLVRGLAGITILATSREPLRIHGEHVFRLSGLQCDPRATPTAEEAMAFPAIELFTARAFARSGYMLSDADAPAVTEICRRLDGNPLAIELVATQTSEFRPELILRMLDDRSHLLTIDVPEAPARQQSLLATLDWSYGLLSETERSLLRAACMFAGTFDVDGAAAVSGLAATDALDVLGQLVAKSLLVVDVNINVITYRLLETTRAFVADRLQQSGEYDEVGGRYADHICTVLERAAQEWAKRPAMEWAGIYGRTLDDLRNALAWAGRDPAHRPSRIRLTLAGILLWNHFSHTEECGTHVSRAVEELSSAQLVGTATEMKLRLWQGGSSMFTDGLKPHAMNAMRRALQISIEIGNVEYRLRCLMMMGVYELFTGEHHAGMRTLEEFSTIAAKEDPSIMPERDAHSGIGEMFVGRLEDARERLAFVQKREQYFGSYGVRYFADPIVLASSVLAQVQWLSGLPDMARRSTVHAFDLGQQAHHTLSMNNVLSYGCAVFYWMGELDECERFVALLEQQVARHGLVARRPVAVFYRAALQYSRDGATAEVVDGLQRAVEDFRGINHLARMPYYLSVLADALMQFGRLGEAETTIRAALDIAHSQDEKWCLPEVLRMQARVAMARGQPDEAQARLERAIKMAQETGGQAWLLRAACDLAALWHEDGRTPAARQLLASAFGSFTEGFTTCDLVKAAALLEKLDVSGEGDGGIA